MSDVTLARVLAADDGVARLWIAGKVFEHPCAEDALLPGDLVRLEGGRVVLVQRPTRPMASDGDLARLAADGGSRYRAVLERAAMLRELRELFDERGFLEVETPAMATCPGLELHLDAVAVELREGMGGAETRRWLVTSPEFHMKRLLAAGMSRIYTIGKAFRSGERGAWHNPEFTMLEWYRVGEDYRAIVADVLALLERAVSAVARLRASRGLDLPTVQLGEPIHVSFAEALGRWAGLDIRDADLPTLRDRARARGLDVRPGDGPADIYLQAMVERVEPRLPKDRIVVIDAWPACLASLARTAPSDPEIAERFEIYAGGVELANGFSELVDPVEQRARFEADLDERRLLGRPTYPIDERFLAALEEGCPPSAGVAVGLDRVLMVAGGYDDIDQVLAFPFERA